MDSSTSRFKCISTSLEKMAKKPALDTSLGEVLDKFLDKLAENDRYLENGIFNTNFGEAALLLQSSVDVYAKKVDLLWERIIEYQKHIITYENERDKDEVERLEERRNRYKRKRRREDDDQQKITRPNQVDKGRYFRKDINLLSESSEIDEDIMHTWRKLNEAETNEDDYVSNKLTCSDATLFQPKDDINTQDDDLGLKYSQIRTTTIIEEIFNLEDNKMLEDAFQGITRMRIASYVVNNYRKEALARHRRKEQFEEDLETYILNFIKSRRKVDVVENIPVIDVNITRLVRKDSMPSLPNNTCDSANVRNSSPQDEPPVLELQIDLPLTPNKKGEKVIATSTEEALLLQAQLSASSLETCKKSEKLGRHSVSEQPIDEEGSSLQDDLEKISSCSELEGSHGSSSCLDHPEVSQNSDDGSRGSIRNSIIDTRGSEKPRSKRKSVEDDDDVAEIIIVTSRQRVVKPPPRCTQPCCVPAKEKIRKTSKDKVLDNQKVLEDTETVKIEKAKRRLGKKEIKKLATGISVSFNQFEQFYTYNYQQDELEEGLTITYISPEVEESDMDTESCCGSIMDYEDSGISIEHNYSLSQNEDPCNNLDKTNLLSDSGVGLSEVASGNFQDVQDDLLNLESTPDKGRLSHLNTSDENMAEDMDLDEAESSQIQELTEESSQIREPDTEESSQIRESTTEEYSQIQEPTTEESSQIREPTTEESSQIQEPTTEESSQIQEPTIEESPIPSVLAEEPATEVPISSVFQNEDSQQSETSNSSGGTESSLTEQDKIDRNVHNWKSFITPRLNSIGNRSDFDIHDYGSQMIDPLELNEIKTFSSIVENKPSSEVARYFIAMLQLANTHNVKIGGKIPGKLSNDTLSIKVLSKEKHHDMLETYQAPSEKTFRQRLALAQSMNPRVILHSTPLVPSSAKRFKPATVGRRIIFN